MNQGIIYRVKSLTIYASGANIISVVIAMRHVIAPARVRIAHSVCSGPKGETDGRTDSPSSFFFSPGPVFPISLGAFFRCSSQEQPVS